MESKSVSALAETAPPATATQANSVRPLDHDLEWIGEYLAEWGNQLLGLVVEALSRHRREVAELVERSGSAPSSGQTLFPSQEREPDLSERTDEELATAPSGEAAVAVLPDESQTHPRDVDTRELALAPVTLFEPCDGVTFQRDGVEEFAEIIEVDDARSRAWVVLVPSGDEIEVPLDELTKVDPEPDDEQPYPGQDPESEADSRTEIDDPHAAHRRWVETVSDPATAASEGRRRIAADGDRAFAEYEIAPLPDGRHAVRYSIEFRCGSHASTAIPWVAYATREACLAAFLAAARQHFRPVADDGGGAWQRARRQMHERLKDGLFGFNEPDVAPDNPPRADSPPLRGSRAVGHPEPPAGNDRFDDPEELD